MVLQRCYSIAPTVTRCNVRTGVISPVMARSHRNSYLLTYAVRSHSAHMRWMRRVSVGGCASMRMMRNNSPDSPRWQSTSPFPPTSNSPDAVGICGCSVTPFPSVCPATRPRIQARKHRNLPQTRYHRRRGGVTGATPARRASQSRAAVSLHSTGWLFPSTHHP